MKRILCSVIAIVCITVTFAQTGLEIVNRMNEMIESHDSDGISMYIDVKIPIIGSVSTKTMHAADKTCFDFVVKENRFITFIEDTVQWIYYPEKNEVLRTTSDDKSVSNPAADAGMDMGMFGNVAEGYDITIKSENLVKWVLACKKKRQNPDKDAPKNITIEVRKDSYMPLVFSTKMMGIDFIMRDFVFGVTEDQVTFNLDNYPGVKIIEQEDTN